jgi:hypothetical protein
MTAKTSGGGLRCPCPRYVHHGHMKPFDQRIALLGCAAKDARTYMNYGGHGILLIEGGPCCKSVPDRYSHGDR